MKRCLANLGIVGKVRSVSYHNAHRHRKAEEGLAHRIDPRASAHLVPIGHEKELHALAEFGKEETVTDKDKKQHGKNGHHDVRGTFDALLHTSEQNSHIDNDSQNSPQKWFDRTADKTMEVIAIHRVGQCLPSGMQGPTREYNIKTKDETSDK